MEPILVAEHLIYRYGTQEVLHDVSLRVDQGELFALVGPDGAGKTTLIRQFCGSLRVQQGRLHLFGQELRVAGRKLLPRLGYLSQQFSLYQDLSVWENIEFFAQVHLLKRFEERANMLLEATGLASFKSRLAGALSGGMKQKLALACNLVHQPEFLLLDEPTTGVDPVTRREFWKILRQFQTEGTTILLATPYLDEAERCDRVAMIHQGTLLGVHAPEEWKQLTPLRVALLPAIQLGQDRDRLGELGVQIEPLGNRLRLRTPTARLSEAERILQRYPELQPIPWGPPTLEDVFLYRLLELSRKEQAA